MIGKRIIHKRYGLATVTHIWRKIVNPVTKDTVLEALTFELLTKEGRKLHNEDRSFKNCESLNVTPTIRSLPRCYENDLTQIIIANES